MLADYVRSLDPTRPVTSALNCVSRWTDTDGFYAALDIGGYNYNLSNHAEDHKRVPVADHRVHRIVPEPPSTTGPWWPTFPTSLAISCGRRSIISANRASDVGTSAMWATPAAEGNGDPLSLARRRLRRPRHLRLPQGQLALPEHRMGPGREALPRRAVARARRQAIRVTTWGVWPVYASWTWPGMEGKPLEVEIYSAATGAPLSGRQADRGEAHHARRAVQGDFNVPYAPGVLKAVAVAGRQAVAETVLRTVGEPAQVRLTADRTALRADGQDLSFITVEAVDENGQPHPNADHQVTFNLKGPGVIAAVGNADMTSEEMYRGTKYNSSAARPSSSFARAQARRPHPHRRRPRTYIRHATPEVRPSESIARKCGRRLRAHTPAAIGPRVPCRLQSTQLTIRPRASPRTPPSERNHQTPHAKSPSSLSRPARPSPQYSRAARSRAAA